MHYNDNPSRQITCTSRPCVCSRVVLQHMGECIDSYLLSPNHHRHMHRQKGRLPWGYGAAARQVLEPVAWKHRRHMQPQQDQMSALGWWYRTKAIAYCIPAAASTHLPSSVLECMLLCNTGPDRCPLQSREDMHLQAAELCFTQHTRNTPTHTQIRKT
jgi:hypothetical protein